MTRTEIKDQVNELMFEIRENTKYYEDTGNLEYLDTAYRAANKLRSILGDHLFTEKRNTE